MQREEIYQRVWGYAMVHGDRSVDVFVRKLRQKLERASPRLALHPHALRDRLPVRGRAASRRRGRAEVAPVAGAASAARSPAVAAAEAAPARRSLRRAGAAIVRGPWARTATRTSATSRSSSLLAVAVWKLPGGGTAPTTISATSSACIFAGGLVFFGYRMYMEHRGRAERRARASRLPLAAAAGRADVAPAATVPRLIAAGRARRRRAAGYRS